jgi:DNA-binding NarL/FixJ family response regulator
VTSIRVLLVDDNESTRLGFRMMLQPEPGIEVVAEAGDGQLAIELARQHAPDVVLMDVRMPRLDGIAATRVIRSAEAAPRVLILTTFDVDHYAFDGIGAGASGFLLKDVTPIQLTDAIRAVHSGDAVITPRITRRMLELGSWTSAAAASGTAASGTAASTTETLSALTAREHEVALAIAEGLNNRELAARFVLSEATIKTYVSRILAKLHARDRIEIVLRVQGGNGRG